MKTDDIDTITAEALDTIIGGRGAVMTKLFGPDATTAWNQYTRSGGKAMTYDQVYAIMSKPFSWF